MAQHTTQFLFNNESLKPNYKQIIAALGQSDSEFQTLKQEIWDAVGACGLQGANLGGAPNKATIDALIAREVLARAPTYSQAPDHFIKRAIAKIIHQENDKKVANQRKAATQAGPSSVQSATPATIPARSGSAPQAASAPSITENTSGRRANTVPPASTSALAQDIISSQFESRDLTPVSQQSATQTINHHVIRTFLNFAHSDKPDQRARFPLTEVCCETEKKFGVFDVQLDQLHSVLEEEMKFDSGEEQIMPQGADSQTLPLLTKRAVQTYIQGLFLENKEIAFTVAPKDKRPRSYSSPKSRRVSKRARIADDSETQLISPRNENENRGLGLTVESDPNAKSADQDPASTNTDSAGQDPISSESARLDPNASSSTESTRRDADASTNTDSAGQDPNSKSTDQDPASTNTDSAIQDSGSSSTTESTRRNPDASTNIDSAGQDPNAKSADQDPTSTNTDSAVQDPAASSHPDNATKDSNAGAARERSASSSSGMSAGKRSTIRSGKQRAATLTHEQNTDPDFELETTIPEEVNPAELVDLPEEDEHKQDGDENFDAALADLAKLDALERASQWVECCRFFKVNPTRTDRGERFKFKGMERSLYPHQMLAVFWMLNQEHSVVQGGFLADEQGLGKTTELLALHVVAASLSRAHTAVRASRQAADGQHLSRDGQTEESVCPSGEPFAVACPCVNNSPSAKLELQRGPTLLIVPPGLITTWQREFQSLGLDKELQMELVIAHGKYGSWGQFNKCKNMLLMDSSSHARPQADRYLVLTAPQSYIGQVFNHSSHSVNRTRLVTGRTSVIGRRIADKSEVYSVSIPSIRWARVIVDEFHTDKGYNANLPKFLRDSDRLLAHYRWAASGTPFEHGPDDMRGYIGGLHSQWPADDQTLQKCGPDQIKELQKSLEKLRQSALDPSRREPDGKMCAEDLQLAGALTIKFKDILLQTMIRRSTESQWFGKALVDLPPLNHKDVACPLSDEDAKMLDKLADEVKEETMNNYREALQRWREGPRKEAEPKPSAAVFLHVARKSRIFSTFPALKRIAEEESLTLTWNEIYKNNWHLLDPNYPNPYLDRLDEIVASSSKLKNVKALLEAMHIIKNHNQPLNKGERKAVLFSQQPIVALITYAALTRIYGSGVGFYWANPKTKERELLVQRFQEYDETLSPLRILVGTTKTMGVGLTLTKADTSVLLEPQWMERDESQAMARIRRISQKAQEVFSYRMYSPRSVIEMAIIDKQRWRIMIRDMTLQAKDETLEDEVDDDN